MLVKGMDEFDQVEHLVALPLPRLASQGVLTRLSPIVRTMAELDQGGFLTFDIACDGKVCFELDGAVSTFLSGVRERLTQRGATRRSTSGTRYWQLDPDVLPGDVVVL